MPIMPTLDRPNLPMLLLVARERLLIRFRPLLHSHGLTEQQWRILRAVHDAGSLEPREIVACCGISGPSLAGMLARMEATGLVERRRFDHDQRRIAVGLTAAGERLVGRLAPRIEAVYAGIEALLGAPAVAGLVRNLQAVIDRLPAEPESGENAAPSEASPSVPGRATGRRRAPLPRPDGPTIDAATGKAAAPLGRKAPARRRR